MILEARNLTRVVLLRGAEQVLLRDVSFRVGPGEVLGVTGPSGSGKTALLRLVDGLDPRSCGEVLLDGQPVGPEALPLFRRHVILVPRVIPALEGSPWETWGEAMEWKTRRFGERMLSLVEAARPLGLEEKMLRRPWAGLDPGLARLAFLGIAMAFRPRVYLLDEPTAGLEEKDRAAVAAWLRDLFGRTAGAIVSSKDEVFLASVARHLLILYDGEVHAEGPPEAVLPAAWLRSQGSGRR